MGIILALFDLQSNGLNIHSSFQQESFPLILQIFNVIILLKAVIIIISIMNE